MLLEEYEYLHKPASFKMQKIEITLTVKQSWPYDKAEKWVAVSYFICHPAREMYKANLGCFFKFSCDT